MKKTTRVRKVPIKTTGKKLSQVPHTNFQDEIYQSDKFLDRTFYITCAICAVLLVTLIIVNIK